MAHFAETSLASCATKKSMDSELDPVNGYAGSRLKGNLIPARGGPSEWFRGWTVMFPKWTWAPALVTLALLVVLFLSLGQPPGPVGR